MGKTGGLPPPTVVKVSGHQLLPERELQIVPTGQRSAPYTVEGGFVLDEEDRLVAIMKRGHPHLFQREAPGLEGAAVAGPEHLGQAGLSKKGKTSELDGWVSCLILMFLRCVLTK